MARRPQNAPVQLGPFAQKLQEIADRLNGLGAPGDQPALFARLASIEERLSGLAGHGADTRALHTQLESIVSRLELLKGRSIDPARLTELFDRVDAAARGGGMSEELLARLENKIEQSAIPAERLERLERSIAENVRTGIGDELLESRIAENALAGIAEQRFARLEELLREERGRPVSSGIDEERFARLESKLDEIGRAHGVVGEGLTPDDVADLSTDITALRRELRSLPGLGEGEGNLGGVLKTIAARLERLSDEPPATAPVLEKQIERIAQLLEDPTHSRLALAHIETSLKSIEQRLDDTRRALLFRTSEESLPEGGSQFEAVAGLARALSDDVTVLKGTTEESEKKTKDALDAVQDTLQAVVKRMAFLERDADLAAAIGGAGGTLAAATARAVAGRGEAGADRIAAGQAGDGARRGTSLGRARGASAGRAGAA